MEIHDFSNEPVSPYQLPDVREVKTHSISPRYRMVNLAKVGGVFSFLCIAFSLVHLQPWFSIPEQLHNLFPFFISVTVFIGITSFVYHWLADPLIRYAIRQQDIILQKGLIFRHITCQPILRIQHIELKRGPLDRIAGLAKLQVFSAGGSAHTFEIPGLPEIQASQLRQFILDHKDLGAR